MSRIVAINCGYYNCKSTNGEVFRSCCRKTKYTGMKSTADVIIYDDEVYNIGVGEPNLRMDKTQSEETKVLILNMLCRQMIASKESFKLVLCCPPLAYDTQSDELPMYLRGRYNVIWNDKPKEIIIEDVVVLPETFVVFNVNNDDNKYDQSILLIIDIGGFTTNICKITYGSFTTDDFLTIQHGMYHLNFTISQYLNGEYKGFNLNTKPDEVDRYREHGLYIDGVEGNIMELEKEKINSICCEFIDAIINGCIDKGWDIASYKKLLTGGGGLALYPLFKEVYYKSAELSKNPLFDNYNGLVSFANEVF